MFSHFAIARVNDYKADRKVFDTFGDISGQIEQEIEKLKRENGSLRFKSEIMYNNLKLLSDILIDSNKNLNPRQRKRKHMLRFFLYINFVLNFALTIIIGYGIYSFSGSIIWAIIGALALTGAASANPIFALLAYPAVEYFFNDGNLTIYSALVVGINVFQLAFSLVMALRDKKTNMTDMSID